MKDNIFAKYSPNVSFIITCFVYCDLGKLNAIFLRTFKNVLQSFSVNYKTKMLNNGFKLDAKL